MPKVIGIVGSRRRNSQQDFQLVRKAFLKVYKSGDSICSGLCSKGADRFAVLLAREFQTPTLWFPADWAKFGKAAGLIRNCDIARNSDVLIACVASDRTGGTEDTIRKYLKESKNHLVLL